MTTGLSRFNFGIWKLRGMKEGFEKGREKGCVIE
jgi:hypothetical protein